ncbi:hypothetical protein HZC53_03055 [Candidatus Uhrbacteria bacterium]|nr:hypothetical protein [Candidatus Uhrbacteria bacterium]
MSTRPIIRSHSSFPPSGQPGRGIIRAHRNAFVTPEDEANMFEAAAQDSARQADAAHLAQLLADEPYKG